MMWRLLPSRPLLSLRRRLASAAHDELLRATGLRRETVARVVSHNPRVLPAEWSAYLAALTDLGFSAGQRNVLLKQEVEELPSTLSVRRINAVLELLSSLGVPKPCAVFTHNPWLALKTSEELHATVDAMAQLLSAAQVRQIVRHNPAALGFSVDEVSGRFLYVQLEMGLSPGVMSARSLWVLRLRTIRDRHTLLLRLGQYRRKTLSRQSETLQRQMLNRILAPPVEEFVEKVAGITMEEWVAFEKTQRTTETVWDFE